MSDERITPSMEMCPHCGGDGTNPVGGDGRLTYDYLKTCGKCGGAGEVPHQPQLTVVPLTLAAAKEYVGQEHRHHAPPVGHKFSVGVEDETGTLRGVAVAGRPVARGLDQQRTLEVVRVATDGCPNACSALYGAVARIAKEMGYERHNVITYTLASEPGTSLCAAGWVADKQVRGRSWDTPSRRRQDVAPTDDKVRWRAAPSPESEAV